MDDFMQVLLIIGFIIFGIFRQINKNKKDKPEQEFPAPLPPEETLSLPYEFEPEAPARTPRPVMPKKNTSYQPIEEGARATATFPAETSPPLQAGDTAPAADSEFAIQSPEDAKRAIIWSEILQRKY